MGSAGHTRRKTYLNLNNKQNESAQAVMLETVDKKARVDEAHGRSRVEHAIVEVEECQDKPKGTE